MIDVFVAVNERQNQDYQKLALESCTDVSGVKLFTIEEQSTVFNTRKSMLNQGSNEYISFVDYDDYAIDFAGVSKYLQIRGWIDALFTNSMVIDKNGNNLVALYDPSVTADIMERKVQLGGSVHQLTIVRRSIYEQAVKNAIRQVSVELQDQGDMIINYEVALLTDWHYKPAIHYGWRQHSASQLHLQNKEAARLIRAAYVEKLVAKNASRK